MITLKRGTFQNPITHKKIQYFCNASSSGKGEPASKDVLKVLVINYRLKGKTDLHGRPYKPSTFYYTKLKDY